MTKQNKIKVRFDDVDGEGFLAAASQEADGVVLDYMQQLGLQKSVNRRAITAATRRQIIEAGSLPFHFGTFVDWRGRLYFHGAGLAPQGKDAGRGVLAAAKGVRLGVQGLRHLMCGVATTWGQDGIDKASMRERVAYVRRMYRDGSLARIVAGAESGEDYTWRLAEEPVQFLALAADLLTALALPRPTDHVSSVFVGYDATCSGLQILAAVTGCEATARMVNVVPRADGKRADIYMSVADALVARCAAMAAGLDEAEAEAEMAANKSGDCWALYWSRAGITRNITKRPVMVYCYGGTKRTFAGSIREDSKAPWKAAMWLAAQMYDNVLADLLPRAHAFMLALQGLARAAAKLGKAVEFTAADGLPFRQAVTEVEKDRVKCPLADGRLIQAVIQRRTKKLSSGKQVSGIAPNIVHHWDALFLRNVVRALAAAGIESFYTVHDCFYLLPGDWAKGWKIIRAVFVQTFSGDVAADVWSQIVDNARAVRRQPQVEAWENEGGLVLPEIDPPTLPTCPAKGSLDLTQAMRSEFLFS